MTDQFDLTEHKWSDGPSLRSSKTSGGNIRLHFGPAHADYVVFDENDAMAISNVFGLLKAERVRIWRKINSMILLKELPDFDDGVRGGLILAANSVLEDD